VETAANVGADIPACVLCAVAVATDGVAGGVGGAFGVADGAIGIHIELVLQASCPQILVMRSDL
jgi:hypothetical protein